MLRGSFDVRMFACSVPVGVTMVLLGFSWCYVGSSGVMPCYPLFGGGTSEYWCVIGCSVLVYRSNVVLPAVWCWYIGVVLCNDGITPFPVVLFWFQSM